MHFKIIDVKAFYLRVKIVSNWDEFVVFVLFTLFFILCNNIRFFWINYYGFIWNRALVKTIDQDVFLRDDSLAAITFFARRLVATFLREHYIVFIAVALNWNDLVVFHAYDFSGHITTTTWFGTLKNENLPLIWCIKTYFSRKFSFCYTTHLTPRTSEPFTFALFDLRSALLRIVVFSF